MTTRARRICPVLRHTLAHRKNLAHRIVFGQRRHVWRRRWRRSAEDILQNPLASQNRRSADRVGSDRENASLPKQSATYAVVRQRDAPEVAAIHIRNFVVFREPVIQE